MKKIIMTMAVAVLIFSGCQMSKASVEKERTIDYSYQDAGLATSERVDILIGQMTVEEKIGQMLQVARDYLNTTDDITNYYLGSLLSGGGSVPYENTPEGWADMVDGYQQKALETPLAIPLIYGVDAVHGHNNMYGATIFPHNIGLGAGNNPELVTAIAHATALEMAATGIDWDFAPCVTVPQDLRWGRTYEGFSSDPAISGSLGAAAVIGYQGLDSEKSLGEGATVLATIKHFAGDGGTEGGVDRGNTVLAEDLYRELHISPYLEGLAAGAGSVMASFNSWNGEKVHGNKYLLTDILRGELGFDGILVSDWAGHSELPGSLKQQIAAVVDAGIDIIMIPDDYPGVFQVMMDLYDKGTITDERLDLSMQRILTKKFELGLFEQPMTDRSYAEYVGCDEHRELARQAVRESVVVLKNDGIIPIQAAGQKILVAGRRAKDLGSQCGGWTLTWQGGRGEITEGTTIYSGLQQAVDSDTDISYSVKYDEGDYDVAIAVLGETPYAEMMGDNQTLVLSASDKELLADLEAAGIPTVAVLVSGRPLIMTEELETVEGFAAVWLPGTEGAGVADVLLGDYNPTGRLPQAWPRSIDQMVNNPADPLFARGFGLSY